MTPPRVLVVTDETVHFLALLSEPATVEKRIADRPGSSPVASPGSHVAFDRRLRDVDAVPAPHTWTTHDVSRADVRRTLEVGDAWASAHARGLSGSR